MVKFKTRFFSFIGKEISKYAIKGGYDYLRGQKAHRQLFHLHK